MAKAAAVWQMVGFHFGKLNEGREFFEAWVSQTDIDLAAMRQACEKLKANAEANRYVTITLASLKAEYLAAVSRSGAQVEHCRCCGVRGWHRIVVAGPSSMAAKPVPRSELARKTAKFATTSLVPCTCSHAERFPGHKSWDDQTVRRLISDFAVDCQGALAAAAEIPRRESVALRPHGMEEAGMPAQGVA